MAETGAGKSTTGNIRLAREDFSKEADEVYLRGGKCVAVITLFISVISEEQATSTCLTTIFCKEDKKAVV